MMKFNLNFRGKMLEIDQKLTRLKLSGISVSVQHTESVGWL